MVMWILISVIAQDVPILVDRNKLLISELFQIQIDRTQTDIGDIPFNLRIQVLCGGMLSGS